MTKVRIYVTYKPSVFDPQGQAITNSIHELGHKSVESVKVGKFFDLYINQKEKALEDEIMAIAQELLVNLNMETYNYKILEEK